MNQETRARVLYERHGPEGLIAQDEEEMERIISFIDEVRAPHPKFHYQRNTVYLRFCHADYHKGAALAELSRLIEIPREQTFAAGDHFNDISMLDGRYAQYPACPSNAIPEVKAAVQQAGGYVAENPCGAGVYEALLLRKIFNLRHRFGKNVRLDPWLLTLGLGASWIWGCDEFAISAARFRPSISLSAGHCTVLSMSRKAWR